MPFSKLTIVATLATIVLKIRRFLIKLWQVVLKRPLISLGVILVMLFAIIAVGSVLRKPKTAKEPKLLAKKVAVYRIGSAPRIDVSAKIEKSGTVKIVALAPGVISAINVKEGNRVSKSAVVVNLGSTYGGANPASIQRQIAQTQYNQQKETFEDQKALLQKQRDLAEKNQDNVDEQRKILQASLDDTRRLVDLNTEVINSINTNISHLQQNNPGGQNDQLIAASQAQRASFESALAQLRNQLNQNEYQAVGENPLGRAAFLQKEITERQLDLQQKSLAFGLEITALQIRLAQINESLLFPSAPFAGTVERVFVKVGQNVNPGTPLVALAGSTKSAKVVALVPQSIAVSISRLEPTKLTINNHNFMVTPDYISTEATDGQLYSATFVLPEEAEGLVTDASTVTVSIPIGYATTGSTMPFIPLDAIFQSTDTSYVFVNDNGRALSRTIKLGSIQGSFAQVIDGLNRDDQVITSRNVIANDPVQPE